MDPKQLVAPINLSALTPPSCGTAEFFERWSDETPFALRLKTVLQSAEYRYLKALKTMLSYRLTPARRGPFSEALGYGDLNAWYERDGNKASGAVSLLAVKRPFVFHRRCLADLLRWLEATLEASADVDGWAPGQIHALAQCLP